MRLVHVAPVFVGIFIALACGSTDDQSKVDNTAATGNILTGNTAGGGTLNPGGATGGANSNGGGGAVIDPNSACATSSADGEAIPVDLYFMVDITGSMNCPVPDMGPCEVANNPPTNGESRWTVLSAALKAFVADPQNQTLGVGMRFFPTGGNGGGNATCNANSYSRPNVEIGPLSMTAQPLTAAINQQRPGGTTPTVPSLTAAIEHATAWQTSHPTHRVAVVYATDGYPKGCEPNNTIPLAADVAAKGAVATPSIPTYVLGVGPNLADLNTIAVSGGTKQAFLVDTTQNAAAQLSAALASIRSTTALDCTYNVPKPPAGQALEPGKVNVNYTNGAGAVTTVGQDPPGTACSAGNGWQYSTDGTQINLCGKACADVKADKGGKIQVLFGCATQIGEPPT